MLYILQWSGALSVLVGYLCFIKKDRFWGSTWSLVGCAFFVTWAWFLDLYGVLLMNLTIGGLSFRGIYLALTQD